MDSENELMSEKLKNRLLYWALAIVPFLGVIGIGKFYDPFLFFIFFLFYLFIYRPLLDIQRLLSLKKIQEKDAWRFFVPFAVDRLKYNRSLWLG